MTQTQTQAKMIWLDQDIFFLLFWDFHEEFFIYPYANNHDNLNEKTHDKNISTLFWITKIIKGQD